MVKIALPLDIEQALLNADQENTASRLEELLRGHANQVQLATDCLDWVAWQGNEYGNETPENIVKVILDNGANPLLARYALNKHETNSSRLIMQAIEAQEATGNAYCTAEGGNLLHQLAENSYYNLEMLLKGDHFIGNIHPSWVNAPDQSGIRPLQVLWNHHFNRNIDRLWRLTSLFIDNGADLITPDDHGKNALDTIEAMVTRHPQFEKVYKDDRIRAHLDARTLERCANTCTFPSTHARRM